jgi:small-conductance mechanosensitive channel
MLIVIFPYLPGSDSPIFRGVSVFLGFLFTFGSAGSLSNIIAGLILTYMRLFKIGDRVKIGDVVGDVIEKSLLVTRIRTIKNEIISIPNSTVMSSHTINYSSDAPEKDLLSTRP